MTDYSLKYYFKLDYFLFFFKKKNKNSFYKRFNIHITYIDDDLKYVTKITNLRINFRDIKRHFLSFIIAIFILFILVMINLNFNLLELDFNDWPFQSESTTFAKYYPNQSDLEILDYYNNKFKGKYPNFLDLLIWSIFTTGFNLTFAIQSFRKYSFLKLLTNLFLSIFDAYSLFMNIINIDWANSWNIGWIGFISFVTETFYSFTFFSIMCNLCSRSLTLSFYISNFKEIFGRNCLLSIFEFFFGLYYLFLGSASFLILILIFLPFFITLPYFLTSFLFTLFPLYIFTIIQNLCTEFLIIPLQFLIGLFLNFKETLKNIFKKETKLEPLVEKLSENDKHPDYSDIDKFKQKDYLFSFIETFIFIRFCYLFNILTIQFAILMLNGFNIFRILRIFFGLPYLSSTYYSFSLRVYFDKFLNVIAKLSSLF